MDFTHAIDKGRSTLTGSSASDVLLRQRLALALVVTVSLTAIVAVPSFFRTYGIVPGRPSPRTIKAPHAMSSVDSYRTDQLRKQASQAVDGLYEIDPNAFLRVERNVNAFFDEVAAVQAMKVPAARKASALDARLGVRIPHAQLVEAVSLDPARLRLVRERAKLFASTFLADRITAANIESKRQSVQLAAKEMDMPESFRQLVGWVTSEYLEPTYVLDAVETARLQRVAAAGVAPVIVRKQQGETVVQEGRIVTPADMQALQELGLLSGRLGVKQAVGYALVVLAVVFTVGLYLHHYRRDIFDSLNRLGMLALIVVAFAAIVKVMSPFSSPYLLPFVAPAVLAGILLGGRTAVITTLVATVLCYLIVPESALPVVVLMIGSLATALMLANIVERKHVFVGAVAGVAMVGFLGMTSSFISGLTLRESALNGWYGLWGGLIGVGISLGSLPFFESAFHVTTDIRLLELADPNQPLMRRLMLEAPGTYNHSMVVGSLVESTAPFIGANPLKARVGAYYHDIGKLKRPLFFVENQQLGQNPHDHTKPHLSTLIVTAHVKDGVDMARGEGVPEEIVDVVAQHHGTSLVSYFFEEAKKGETKQDVSEDDYRYASVKPRTREAALVMLADAVEAAARTMRRPTPGKLEHLSKKMIKARLDDGQLDESGLTLGDLDEIGRHFAQALASIYHARIEYPDVKVTPITKARDVRDGKGQ